jgi:hypothetical protein
MTVLTSLLDGFTQMRPEMPEDEAIESSPGSCTGH